MQPGSYRSHNSGASRPFGIAGLVQVTPLNIATNTQTCLLAPRTSPVPCASGLAIVDALLWSCLQFAALANVHQ